MVPTALRWWGFLRMRSSRWKELVCRRSPATRGVLVKRRKGSIRPESSVGGLALRNWRFRLFSGFGEQVETATVEIDRMNEVLPVAEASCGVLHPLDFGVDRFAAGVGNPVSQIRNDVLEPTLEHPRYFDHRLESASCSPSMPPAEMLSRRSFVDVIV